MPKALINGVNLYYEVTGQGFPLVWSHEFAGDYRSWDPQVKFFSRRYQVITYSGRGYYPSDVPPDLEAYSQEQVVEDLYGLLQHLGIRQAYIGGLSMGGNVALNFGFSHPEMAKALIVAATGSGTTNNEAFQKEGTEISRRFEEEGMEVMGEEYARGPARVQYLRKDPKGWEEFKNGLVAHSAIGSAYTFRGIIVRRPTIFALEDKLRALNVPTLILIGDEDEPCIEPAVFMKRHIPRSGLVVLPQCGHTANLEEPDLFNRAVLDFLTAVEADRWVMREAIPSSGGMLTRQP